ncbi:sulfurtransferase [Pelagibius litoralis]|uniref:Sulfurtransferase n=1 Tax=Pelagibius litoralis TaxID=374515 RepID=A0A967F0K0_9PROT|nr:sulfurtransferase [Pelagibius litoralis]NIA70854.1 sulfurtransferase [Pelagibius litoralis]
MRLLNLKLGRLLAPFALAALTACASQAADKGYANADLLTDTKALSVMMESGPVSVVDVRPKEAYDEAHIPGAVHLGADDVIDPDSHVEGDLLPHETLAAMLGERGIDKDTPVVFYDDEGGFHAARLFWMVEYFGHRQASVLNGGLPKWEAEGRDVTTEAPAVTAKVFAYTPTPRRLATADWLLDREGDNSVIVIDVRPEKLYHAGHVPWAQSIPWKQNLAGDGTLKPASVLLAHFAGLGVTPDKNVAVHCQNGKAAAHSYFTLRLLGYPRVRSYDRSWAEWGPADDLPKVVDRIDG